MSTTIIVTGAYGHLGNNIIRELQNSNYNIIGLVLPFELEKSKLIFKESNNLKIIVADITCLDSLDKVFNTINDIIYVIHTAGIVSIGLLKYKTIYNVNVNGTLNILKMCSKYSVRKLIYTSSVHAIAEIPIPNTIEETIQFNPETVKGHYAKTKAIATSEVLKYASYSNTQVIVIHPSGIIGPNDYTEGHTTTLIKNYIKSNFLFIPKGGYNFVDVRDVAHGMIITMENSALNQCYILSGHYTTIEDIYKILMKYTGKKKRTYKVPTIILKIFAKINEILAQITHKKPVLSSYSLHTLTSNSNFSMLKACKDLGYKSRPIEETIIDTYNFINCF